MDKIQLQNRTRCFAIKVFKIVEEESDESLF
jgi:hypothetical protein